MKKAAILTVVASLVIAAPGAALARHGHRPPRRHRGHRYRRGCDRLATAAAFAGFVDRFDRGWRRPCYEYYRPFPGHPVVYRGAWPYEYYRRLRRCR